MTFQLYVDKNTDLMRSTFIAVGLAELLDKIPRRKVGREGARSAPQVVTLHDQGSCYVIQSALSVEMLTEAIQSRGFLPPLLPAISKPLTKKEQELLEQGKSSEEELLLKYIPRRFEDIGGRRVDYKEEKDIYEIYRKYRPKKEAPREEDGPKEPHPDFPVWAHLNSYFGKGSAMRTGYPGVLHAWNAHRDDVALALWELILSCYGNFPNATAEAQVTWEQNLKPLLAYNDYPLSTEISALAVVSPSTSKGVSAASGFNRLTEDTPSEFWLEMYFAFAGFMNIAMPYNIGNDVVTYYPIPRSITLKALQAIMQQHRKSTDTRRLYIYSNSLPRIKLDVLSQITFYKNMVDHFIEGMNDGTLPDDFPLDSISSIVGYYYKNVSTQIPFDETHFALPAWLPEEANPELLNDTKEILENHYRLIEGVRGRPPRYQITGDELALIDSYRRYLTQGKAEDWVRFAIQFGMYRFRNMTEMRLPLLTIQLFKESLPMVLNDRKDYRPILENPGFQAIAGAINYCTSYSRYKKDVQKDRTFPFKVRHGLGDDLLRNAHNPELFLSDLSDFIHDYRRESISVHANTGKTRSEIEADHIYDVTALVAEYGSRIVAHLLVATGYAARFGTEN